MRKLVFNISTAKKLLEMMSGQTIPSSRFPEGIAELMIQEGIMTSFNNGSRRSYTISSPQLCERYIMNRFTEGISLQKWIDIKESSSMTRSDLVQAGVNSKMNKTRTFKGFLVSSYDTIDAKLNGRSLQINTVEGMSLFIQDYMSFEIPNDVVIIGIENAENFQNIRMQSYLFPDMTVLFVSRYPQGQSQDLIKWLQSIPNSYLHFGDFDLAGVQIYQSEFYAKLGKRASLFIPNDIEQRIKTGSCTLYDKQFVKYSNLQIKDDRVRRLVDYIHKYRRTYEQEGYIL